MYTDHDRIKQRIANGELIGFEFVDNYSTIGECLVLRFNTYPPLRPIRPHRYAEYQAVLTNWIKQFKTDKTDETGEPNETEKAGIAAHATSACTT